MPRCPQPSLPARPSTEGRMSVAGPPQADAPDVLQRTYSQRVEDVSGVLPEGLVHGLRDDHGTGDGDVDDAAGEVDDRAVVVAFQGEDVAVGQAHPHVG